MRKMIPKPMTTRKPMRILLLMANHPSLGFNVFCSHPIPLIHRAESLDLTRVVLSRDKLRRNQGQENGVNRVFIRVESCI